MSAVDQGRQISEFYDNYARLSHTNYSMIYQYRDLDSFWNIIDSDSFWASNARFSNDKAEQTMGIQELKKLLNDSEKERLKLEDCYIICFCKKDDKLSQWRGYAKNGVSIGFDFHAVLPFYVDKKIRIYNSCYDVNYIKKDLPLDELEYTFKVTRDENGNLTKLPQHIPYIKHAGFEEEEECRLVFFNKSGSIDSYVHYREGSRHERIPYIKVGLKSEDDDKKNCTIRLLIGKSPVSGQKVSDIYDIIKNRTMALNAKVISCFDPEMSSTSCKEHDDVACWGCSQRLINPMKDCSQNYEYQECGYTKNMGFCPETARNYIANKDLNYIMISAGKNQEAVFKVVDQIITEYNNEITLEDNKISVWCEGHLPIRTITVGPLENREEIKESIEHYCRNHYWLKYVKVKMSSIPYRS